MMAEKRAQGKPDKRSKLHKLMHLLGRLMPANKQGESVQAVQMMYRLDRIRDLLKAGPLRRFWQKKRGKSAWPVAAGTYIVGDPSACVAVCVLTSTELMDPLARLPGVAIAGLVYTPNLGIEKIIRNVTSNRAIRFLLLCGKESPVFHPAQALRALLTDGVEADKHIIGAQGPLPVLKNLSSAQISAFRNQVELVDYTGTMDLPMLADHIQSMAQRDPGPFMERWAQEGSLSPETKEEQPDRFVRLRPGGKRQPLAYDPNGFFIVTLDQDGHEIIVRHYLPDNIPAHEMRGRSAESLLLGLLRENLVSQLSHAGYLGIELAKAEAALRFGWHYEQDRPLSTQKI
jgi:tetrahydromethanopterin S-methyltransferase subunit A